VFNTDDGRAKFLETTWRGLQESKAKERDRHRFLVNNGRTNHVWQNAYLDVENEFVSDRWPYPFIEMNPEDMAELGLNAGDLVEVHNTNGSTQAIAQPTPTAKRNETFMLFGYPTGVQGNVVSETVNELIIPEYKITWADIRKLADKPETTDHLSFKSPLYREG
jgi:arsenite oxidase large subunit